MKHKKLFITSLLFGTLSLYPILWWIYIFNAHPEASHFEKQAIFDDTILFGKNPFSTLQTHLIVIVLGILSIIGLSILIKRKLKINLFFILTLILLIIFSISTFLNIWSIL